jgi:hypothetical protein
MSVERTDIESLGYRIVAATKHPDGVSYDAYRPGFKRLVRGEVMPTYHTALYALYERITNAV